MEGTYSEFKRFAGLERVPLVQPERTTWTEGYMSSRIRSKPGFDSEGTDEPIQEQAFLCVPDEASPSYGPPALENWKCSR